VEVVQYTLETKNTQNNTINNFGWKAFWESSPDKKGKVHTCTGTEALYRPYGP